MAEEDDLARLQDLVYEAAIIPERWPDALQAINDAAHKLLCNPVIEDYKLEIVE